MQRPGPAHCSSIHIAAKSLGHAAVTVSVTEYEEYLESSATFAAYEPLKVRYFMVRNWHFCSQSPLCPLRGSAYLWSLFRSVIFILSLLTLPFLDLALSSNLSIWCLLPHVSATGISLLNQQVLDISLSFFFFTEVYVKYMKYTNPKVYYWIFTYAYTSVNINLNKI